MPSCLRNALIGAGTVFVSAVAPLAASAHEVYVLSQPEIAGGLTSAPFDMIGVIRDNLTQFVFWAFIAALVIFVVFFVSIIRPLERRLDPLLAKLPPYAPAVSRVTIGVSFLAAAYYQALFGPELPLSGTFGAWSDPVTALLIILGLLITFGIYTRFAALAALALFAVEIAGHGVYMLTYANYFGELVLLVILGAHSVAFHDASGDRRLPEALRALKERLAPYAFPILRASFGISLFYASSYAKILHNQLALQVAELPLAGHPRSLAGVFGFEPHFLVLGAAIVEIVIALFFILGIEIRFTSLFLLFWLSLSLWYFGEVVWPHIILIGIPIAFICWGYDRYSLEGRLFKRKDREPVL